MELLSRLSASHMQSSASISPGLPDPMAFAFIQKAPKVGLGQVAGVAHKNPKGLTYNSMQNSEDS